MGSVEPGLVCRVEGPPGVSKGQASPGRGFALEAPGCCELAVFCELDVFVVCSSCVPRSLLSMLPRVCLSRSSHPVPLLMLARPVARYKSKRHTGLNVGYKPG